MSEWIKCSERVPDSSSDVTVFSEKYGVVNGYYWPGGEYVEGEKYKWYVCCGVAEEIACDVTHWQPLPPPPQD